MNKCKTINHRDLEQNIGGKICDCDGYLQIKVAGYYPHYNKIVVAAQRSRDQSKFFLAPRDPKTDISDGIPLAGRYVVINGKCCTQDEILRCCTLSNPADTWIDTPDSIYITRLLIAGAIRVLISCDDLNNPATCTPEFIQAKKDGRVTIV